MQLDMYERKMKEFTESLELYSAAYTYRINSNYILYQSACVQRVQRQLKFPERKTIV